METLSKIQLTAPTSIALVVGADCPPDEHFDELQEVTWCADGVEANDIWYVRQDLVDASDEDMDYEVYVNDEKWASSTDFDEAFGYAMGYLEDGEGTVEIHEVRRKGIVYLNPLENFNDDQSELFE